MNQNINAFKNSLQTIAVLSKRDDLIHRTGWGEINFESAETDVKSVIHMAQDLCSLPVELLPDSVIDQGRNAADRLMQPLTQLVDFSLTVGGDINQRRNDLVGRIHTTADEFSRVVGLWIPYLSYHRGDAEENIKKLNQAINTVEAKGNEHLNLLKERSEEAAQLVESIKSASAEAGVAVYTQDFDKESDMNNTTAKSWLIATCVFALSTLGFIIGFYYAELTAPTLVALLPKLSCRLLLITTLFTAAVWCGRMYKAMRNQALQNRHRALGLKTFRAFVDAASDVQTRDAVLRETTHTIFSSTPTGLITDHGSNDTDSSVVQIAGGMLTSAATK